MAWSLLRWFISYATLTVPKAAGPVAFSLVALSLTGDTSGGAAMIFAMTLAQVLGALPITRLGRKFRSTWVLRILVGFRTLAFALMSVCVATGADFLWLILLAAIAGSVNGAAYGYLRALLNGFTPPDRLPRALGIAATLNEVTFVASPVFASGLGSISPVWGILALTILGGLPVLVAPRSDAVLTDSASLRDGSVLSPAILLWLICAAADGAAIAAIEIGAVALALNFG